jgi:hypothetical protein
LARTVTEPRVFERGLGANWHDASANSRVKKPEEFVLSRPDPQFGPAQQPQNRQELRLKFARI